MYWVIILCLAVLAFAFLKMNHARHSLFFVVIILLLLFVYITVSRVVKENNINIKSLEGIEKASRVYFSWLGVFFGNLGEITGNAIKMDWSMKNKTEEVVINEKVK
jgi:hypothetical protein